MRLCSGIYHFDGKVIVSGDIVEVIEYSKGVFRGFVNVNGRRGNGNITDEQKAKNRERVLNKARKEFIRIVYANIGQYGDIKPKFVTFTFADNVRDLREANRIWSKFIMRLNYRVYGKKCSELQYGVVPEFQERGAVHYHVIFFNLPYIDNEELAKIWGQGFIKINAIDNIKNVVAYVCKYMTSSFEDERLRGHKAYYFSRGVKKPEEIYLDHEDLERIRKSLPSEAKVYEAEFNNEYLGVVKYEQYDLSNVESIQLNKFYVELSSLVCYNRLRNSYRSSSSPIFIAEFAGYKLNVVEFAGYTAELARGGRHRVSGGCPTAATLLCTSTAQ